MKCPKCGKDYTGIPAMSRVDNKTKICPRCGFVEGLEAAGHTVEEMEATLDRVFNFAGKYYGLS